jgi:hypothetical protein
VFNLRAAAVQLPRHRVFNLTAVINLKIPSVEYMNKWQIDSYDMKLAKQKGASSKASFDNQFLYLQALYRKAFEDFSKSKFDFDKYEKILSNSALGYIPKTTNQSLCQTYSGLECSYIYILNTFHIENLANDDIILLKSKLKNGEIVIDEPLLELVERTYPEVLRLHSQDFEAHRPLPNKTTDVNNALVFGIAHSAKYDANGNLVDRENEAKKREFIDNLIPDMESEFSKSFGHPVGVF